MSKETQNKEPGKFWHGALAGAAIALAAKAIISIVIICVILLELTAYAKNNPYIVQSALYEIMYSNQDIDWSDFIIEDESDDTDIWWYTDETSEDQQELYDKIALVKELINDYFLFDYSDEELNDWMFVGLVAGLNDPYAAYYTADELQTYYEDRDGSFYGIGAQISIDSSTYIKTITIVYEDTPAESSGLQVGDIIIGVDGIDVTYYDLDTTVAMVRGEKGTDVVLTIYRDDEYMDITVTRDEITKKEVTYELLDNKIGYIKINSYTVSAAEQMKEALLDLNSQGMISLIVDERGNGGGAVESVVNISSMFLDDNATIFYEQDKWGNTQTYTVPAGSKICDVPMVVLVNEYSASASELFAGAMQDNGRAGIVGTQTYGKGIVQQTIQLGDGSAVKFTICYYFTPSGTCIHEIGITPDVVVEQGDNEEIDDQLEAAIQMVIN